MKLKVILISMILLVCFSVSSQTYQLKSNKITISEGYGAKTTPVNISMKWDIQNERIVIFSKDQQIIDYDEIRNYTDSQGYKVVECSGTDMDYVSMGIEFHINLRINHVILMTSYNNIAYSYSCKIVG